MSKHEEAEEKFSDDPEEQLRIENELLKLKLNAELGGKFEALTDIPPEIEHEFLKNVIAFENHHANAEILTVFDVLEKPGFEIADNLNDEQIAIELSRIEAIMEERAIVVDYAVDYSARVKYCFLTEELFKHESSMFSMPGMTTHYMYEEFHPNHDYEINSKTEEFLNDWLNQEIKLDYSLIADTCTNEQGDNVERAQLMQKVIWFYESYPTFNSADFSILSVAFLVDETGQGAGTSKGTLSYGATMENGETLLFAGDFTVHFVCSYNYWQINYFKMPGLDG